MLLSLAMFAGALPGHPSQAAPPGLERLVQECDRIVEARVAAIHEIPRPQQRPDPADDRARVEGGYQVLELTMDQVIWGDSATKSLFVLDDPSSYWLRLHGQPRIGERSIWFLARDPGFEKIDLVSREKLEKLAGSAGLQVAAMNGLGRLCIESHNESSVVCLPTDVWALPDGIRVVGTHSTAKPDREWKQVDESEFRIWLRQSLEVTAPSIEVTVHSNGPGNPRVTIDRAGHAERSGTKRDNAVLEIGVAGVASILECAEREKFFELPSQLGSSLGPDSAVYQLRIRTAAGSASIRLHGPADPLRDSSSMLEAHARAMRVWNAIPLARDWKVNGH